MLATLVDAPPRAGGWLYEPKLDGVRVLVYANGGNVRPVLPQPEAARRRLSRAGRRALASRSAATPCSTARSSPWIPTTGQSSFSRLQRGCSSATRFAPGASGVAVELYLFDCLFYEGIDLTSLPLVDRKAVLRDVVWYDDPIRFTPFRTTGSAAMFREACAKGAEGSSPSGRRAGTSAPGRPTGSRSSACHQQEFVVGGYTAPKGSRENLGALLVGYYEQGALRYAGKVGTGYDRATLEMLQRKLAPLHRRTSPFAPGPVAGGRGAVGDAEARGRDRVRRVDAGRAAAASALPGDPGGQDGGGGAEEG